MKRTVWTVSLLASLTLSAQESRVGASRIWDDKALEDWATPIAALGVRPSHYTPAEYYSVPGENLRTYPVYRPDREPLGYWDWLQTQKPQPLVDAAKLRTRQDWIQAGETAFQTVAARGLRTQDREKIKLYRDRKAFEGVWTRADGSLLADRWVVTDHGVELRATACAGCHARARADGTVFWGAPQGALPAGSRDFSLLPLTGGGDDEPAGIRVWRSFTVPWAPDERIERLRDAPDAAALISAMRPGIPGVLSRTHGNPYYTTKIPDLNNLQYSRYMDATATHRLRGPEDVARYAAFISGVDPMEFGKYKILSPEQRHITFRYGDEVLYAIAVYLMSLEPPKNPDPGPPPLIARGRQIFERETCINCHVPPNYSSGKLTLAQGYTVPADHPSQTDIVSVSVGTDPGLATKTRKGTGFYKILETQLKGLVAKQQDARETISVYRSWAVGRDSREPVRPVDLSDRLRSYMKVCIVFALVLLSLEAWLSRLTVRGYVAFVLLSFGLALAREDGPLQIERVRRWMDYRVAVAKSARLGRQILQFESNSAEQEKIDSLREDWTQRHTNVLLSVVRDSASRARQAAQHGRRQTLSEVA